MIFQVVVDKAAEAEAATRGLYVKKVDPMAMPSVSNMASFEACVGELTQFMFINSSSFPSEGMVAAATSLVEGAQRVLE